MPCSKASITKTYKCDKDGCVCIPTNGAARVCLSTNETGNIVRCDCKCDTKCECNENCTCINTAGLTCICVCRDQNGRIKTCEDCSCQPKQAETQSCKGKGNVTCCCISGNEKCACLNCSCCETGKNKCGKGSCVTTCKGKKAACTCKGDSKSKQVDGSFKDRTIQSNNCRGNCDEKCKCSCVEQEDALKANVCARKACSGNCKYQGNADSCVCICKNKQGETVCCDDCKCDGTKTCYKKGCVCVRKESSCKCKSLETRCCGSCDDKFNCSGRKQGPASKAKNCTGGTCSGNCKCQGNKNSCVCVCKDNQGEKVCCDDCKCDDNNRCDKEGCLCIRKGCTFKSVKINYCENCDEKCKCSCVEQNAAIKPYKSAENACGENCKCMGNANSCVCICKNKQGENVCCDDCKCDKNNICDKQGCVCVPTEAFCKGQPVKPNCCENCDAKCKCSCVEQVALLNINTCAGKACGENCKCQGNANSCVCVCKNKQGENVCCDNCKCDNKNICEKKGCVCVPKEDSCKGQPTKANCCVNCDATCKCSCVAQEAVVNAKSCAGKVCVENCMCQGNGNSCVCICMNKQGDTVCCEDCKCDNNNICDKKGCVCIRKESPCKSKSVEASCCENCDENGKCCCDDNTCAEACIRNCKCQGNTNSSVCVCKNKEGEGICCYDCKCNSNQRCDNKGCTCIPSASASCNKKTDQPKCCC